MKKITLYPEPIWKLKSGTVFQGTPETLLKGRDFWRPSLRRCRLCAQIKQERKMYLSFQGNVALSSSHCFSQWFSKLPYEQNGAWNRQNGTSASPHPQWNILMELLLPAFCTKIIWFFHILRKENFKFSVNVVTFNKYHHYVFRYLIIRVFRGCIYLVVPCPVRLGTISTFMV